MLRSNASSFAIVANGFADGPAQALRDYLVAGGRDVFTAFHPLTPEQGTQHVVARYEAGRRVEERAIRLLLKPPLSFTLDPLVPLLPPKVDAWFGFNPLACGRGLIARRQGRAGFVVLWSVDFVPDRFGKRTLPTHLYDRLDRLCCLHADARIELSGGAADARRQRHGLPESAPLAHIVPMGAWLERAPTTPEDGFRSGRVVFLGHLVPRQGVELLLEALALLAAKGGDFSADVVGTGPLEASLAEHASALGLERRVRFHGFVAGHREIEAILARASIAVAPYRPGEGTFTEYADPGKLKAYLAAGLPIVLTGVPPNAAELAREAGAEIVPFDASALADALARGVASGEAWRERRRAALDYVQRFDWNLLLAGLLAKLGLEEQQ